MYLLKLFVFEKDSYIWKKDFSMFKSWPTKYTAVYVTFEG